MDTRPENRDLESARCGWKAVTPATALLLPVPGGGGAGAGDISRFSPRIDRIFPEEALNPFFGAQDEVGRIFGISF